MNVATPCLSDPGRTNAVSKTRILPAVHVGAARFDEGSATACAVPPFSTSGRDARRPRRASFCLCASARLRSGAKASASESRAKFPFQTARPADVSER